MNIHLPHYRTPLVVYHYSSVPCILGNDPIISNHYLIDYIYTRTLSTVIETMGEHRDVCHLVLSPEAANLAEERQLY